jgi:outer membrane protein assembly factor BamB
MSKLIIRYPDNVIKEVEFVKPKYTIGTAGDNDLVLEHEEVAPHQAEIYNADGTYSIADVSDNKSTTVNGKNIERVNINYGDRISFGPVIGLFYPSKTSGVGEKTKLFIYMTAGAVIIILSIVLIFYFTSRKLFSDVSKQIGPILPSEELLEEDSAEQEQTGVVGRGAYEEEEITAGGEKSGKGFSFRLFSRESGVSLPEPTQEAIANRAAVAVPRGIRRMFFRKIRMPVAPERAFAAEAGEYIPEETGFEQMAEIPSELEEGFQVEESGEAAEDELYEEEETFPQERGFLKNLFTPVVRLFKQEEEVPRFFESEEETYETSRGERPLSKQKPSNEDIKRILDPLAVIGGSEIPEVSVSKFEDSPVYSEDELQAFKSKESLNQVAVSAGENRNTRVVWQYSEEGQNAPILRAGTIGKINRDKYHDFVFGSKDGRLIALNGFTGEEIISQDMGGPFYEPVTEDIDNDRTDEIIVVFEDGDIIALNSGAERLWIYEGTDKITSLPLLLDVNKDKIRDIIFTTLGMDIVAIDGTTGFEIWRFFDAESEIVFSPVAVRLNGDTVKDVVFSTLNGFLYGIDGKTGWGLWKEPIFGKPAGSVAVGNIDGDRSRDIITLTRKGVLSGFRRDGSLLFTQNQEAAYGIAPSIGDMDGDGDNEIVIMDEHGVVKAIEGKTRNEKWVFETEEGLSLSRLALSDVNLDGSLDVILVSLSGVLFVINGETGTLEAFFNYGDYVLTTPIIFDIAGDRLPEITACTYAGVVFSVQLTDQPGFFPLRKRSFWASTHHDKENTGYSKHSYLNLIKLPWNL